jgi:iron complex outermembrane receptor protein
MVDGHRMNDAIYEQAMVGTEFSLDIDLVERVEVVLGPSSSLYGTNAVFAVINVITRDASTFHGLELEADAGSWNTYRGRISYGGRIAGVDAVLSGTFYGSKGQNRLYYPEYDSPATNNGIAAHVDDDQFESGFAKLSAHGLRFQAGWGSREKADPTGAWEVTFNDPDSRSTDEHGYLDLRYEHSLGSTTTMMARTYFDSALNRGHYPYDNGSGSSVLNEDFSRGESWGMELQTSSKLRDRYRLTTGLEYRNDFRQQMTNFDVAPANVDLDYDHSSFVIAPYIEAELPLLRTLTVTPSVREDYNPRVGWMLSPRLAINYRPLNQTTIKLMYGEAFRSPNAYELYYYPGTPALKAERDRGWEAGLDQGLTRNIGLKVAVYNNLLNNFIARSSDTDDAQPFSNEAHSGSAGVEVQADGQWESGLRLSATYSNSFIQHDVDHTWLQNSPKNLAKVYASVPLFKRTAYATLDGQYIGRRLSLMRDVVSPYTVFNASVLMHMPVRGLDLSASLFNALNKTFYDPGAQQHAEQQIQQDGRGFRVKLVWNPGGSK